MTTPKKINWLLLAALVGACGSAPLSTTAVSRAKSAVSAAEAVGAQSHPPAALHMKMARDSIKDAEALAKAGDTEQAVRLLDEAEADAQLALALTREDHMRQEASEAVAQERALEQQ